MQAQILLQHGHLFPWFAVAFGGGVAWYFALRFEPGLSVAWALLGGSVVGLIVVLRLRYLIGIIWVLPLLLGAGFGWAALNAHLHSAPRLTFHYYGPIYGRVVGIDRSSSHALRLTLDHVLLSGVAPEKTPARVRVALHGDQGWLIAVPGQHIGLTGHLSAPNGPVEPGGFDFQRHAWFLKLGAVGYTRTPALEMKAPERSRWVDQKRFQISRHVAGYLGGDVGGFAAAVTTGDRSGFSQEAIEDLRITNLAHLLAISGLHMGLLAGFLFGALRLLLSLWPPWAMRLPVKKIAALAVLFGATVYLLMSGSSIATQRAYIMAAVALIAVSLDRRALTLRAVAIAAFLVLLIRPSSLLSPGFQMSFAATTALVFAFSALRDAPDLGLRPWQKSLLGLFVSSFVAGLATAPFAAAHFNQWAAYGLLANLTAVPVMGMVVIPGAVLAAVLAPVGLEWLGLEVMGVGLRWILLVAEHVRALEGARIRIVTPDSVVLPLLIFGALWGMLWQGHARWGGTLMIGAALWFWAHTGRPDVLIAEDGKIVGVLQEGKRALTKARGQGFVAQSWLENDGEGVGQAEAAARLTPVHRGVVSADLGDLTVTHYQGKRGASVFEGCLPGEMIVTDQTIRASGPCQIFGPERLQASGAVAIWLRDGEILIDSVKKQRGQRLWSPPEQVSEQDADQ